MVKDIKMASNNETAEIHSPPRILQINGDEKNGYRITIEKPNNISSEKWETSYTKIKEALDLLNIKVSKILKGKNPIVQPPHKQISE